MRTIEVMEQNLGWYWQWATASPFRSWVVLGACGVVLFVCLAMELLGLREWERAFSGVVLLAVFTALIWQPERERQ